MCGGERAGGTHRVNASHTQAAADTAEAATAEVQKHSRRQEKHARAQGGGQASMQRKLTSERLQGEEAATMLFPSQRKAVRVQSSDAQTRLDRQLYASTAANPSFEFCIS